MDNYYGKSLCCNTNIWMLSDILQANVCLLRGKKMLSSKATGHFPLRKFLVRLIFTSIYMALITLIAAAVPFFGDFVYIFGAIGFTPLDFVFPSVVYLKVGRMPKDTKYHLSMQLLNFAIATWFSVIAVLACIGAV